MSKEAEYQKLFLECFKGNNEKAMHLFNIPLVFYQHILLYNEEPNILAKYFLEKQYGSSYTLVPRIVNANLDGEYTDVEFFETSFKNGAIGHIEFDMFSYTRSQVYYVMDSVIQPMIETFDISKMMDTTCGKKKVIFLKNMDLVLRNANDDKIIRKLITWLEKYIETTIFIFSFIPGFSKISEELSSYCMRVKTNRILNSPSVDLCIEEWVFQQYGQKKVISELRQIGSCMNFRCFMRYLVVDGYYERLYEIIEELRSSKIDQKKKFISIREFIIEWLQEGKNHNELVHEVTNYVYSSSLSEEQQKRYIIELANRSCYIENSKKIIYHLENILSTFID